MVWPLLAGAVLLLASLLSYALAMSLIVRVVARLIQRGYAGLGLRKNLTIMALVLPITAAAHLTQIALWAVAFLFCGAIPDFERAFYFSAQNYTALGYGDVLLSDRWRLLGPLEAINGLLFFGLSTALLFAIVSHLIANRLRVEIGYRNEAAVNQGPLAAGDAGWNGAEDFLSGGRLSATEDKA
jgi:Ion channel